MGIELILILMKTASIPSQGRRRLPGGDRKRYHGCFPGTGPAVRPARQWRSRPHEVRSESDRYGVSRISAAESLSLARCCLQRNQGQLSSSVVCGIVKGLLK